MSDERKKDKPVHEVWVANIKATVWQNQGDTWPWYSVNLSRMYKDKATQQWKSAQSFGRDDLLVVAEVSRLVWAWVVDAQAKDRKSGNKHAQQQQTDESSDGTAVDLPY